MRSITCPRCGKTSYSQWDIAEKYCGFCHQFHDSKLGLNSGDVIVAHAAEEGYGIQIGEVFLRTHGPDACSGEHCTIHNPSDHHMVGWPLNWRGDRGIMERLCPHGRGHPDPDDLDHLERVGRSDGGVHGCDGCCASTMVRNTP